MSRAYTNYIIDHCNNVNKAYSWLVEHDIIQDKFTHRIVAHDISKWSDEEYKAYDKYFYGKEKTDVVKEAFNLAWLHHIHANPHHWQHWVLINDEDGMVTLEMPEEYAVEMICDWFAFSHKLGKLDEIHKWYNTHKTTMMLHKNTRAFVEDTLDKIKRCLDKEKAV